MLSTQYRACNLLVSTYSNLWTGVLRLPGQGCGTVFQLVVYKRTSAMNSLSIILNIYLLFVYYIEHYHHHHHHLLACHCLIKGYLTWLDWVCIYIVGYFHIWMSSASVGAPASQSTGTRLLSTAATGSASTFSAIRPASRLAPLATWSLPELYLI